FQHARRFSQSGRDHSGDRGAGRLRTRQAQPAARTRHHPAADPDVRRLRRLGAALGLPGRRHAPPRAGGVHDLPGVGAVAAAAGTPAFARLLAAAAIVILVACYFGVAFMPTRAIHQADDIGVLETAADIGPGDLTGDWRGLFAHKNGAGAAMVVLIFISIFVGRRLSRPLGAAIAICAAV